MLHLPERAAGPLRFLATVPSMRDPSFGLTDLLGPVDRETFFATSWERWPLVVRRGRRNHYAQLLTLEDIDRLLFAQEQRYPSVRLAKVGSSFPPSSFTEDIAWGGSSFHGVIKTDALLTEYRAGATIIVDALHRTWKPIALLCKSLEAELNHPTQVNVYLTPPDAQGFGRHYDTHDAFILQIAGRKHWRIYESALHLPLPSQPWDPARYDVGALIEEVALEPGDLIYIPRGFVHEAMTSDTQSLHVTLGINAYTWMDVFAEALSRCRQDARFRESLPVGFGSLDGTAPAMQAKLAELATALAGIAGVEDLFARLDERFVDSRRPLLDGQIAAVDRLAAVDSDTVLRRLPHVVFRLRADGDAVRLRFQGKELRFPAFVEPALRHIAEHPEVRVGALPNALDADGKLVLARRLIREGFLWPADA